MTLRLAKDCFDVGLFTLDPAMLDFMRTDVGLGEPEVLRVSRSSTQYRFDVDGSVVKVNIGDGSGRAPVGRTGYRSITVASDDTTHPDRLVGPDGVVVDVVPRGGAVGQLGVTLAVPSLESTASFFDEALGWERCGDQAFRVGRSLLSLVEDPDASAEHVPTPVGWTYLTVQVFDCDAETDVARTARATVTLEPITLGATARISMVADPFGNLVEISQRASLTGPLPESA